MGDLSGGGPLVDDVVLGAGLAGLVDGAVDIGGFAVEPGMVVPGAAVCARAGEASREPRAINAPRRERRIVTSFNGRTC